MTRRAATLDLGPDLALPVAVLTNTVGIFGRKRRGKTTTVSVMLEELVEHGGTFAYLDPKDDAWGLRASADGDGPGVDCVVMGGDHADVPLDPGAGAVAARLAVVDGYNLVLSLNRMTVDEQIRFVADFSETALHACQRSVLIVYDEAPRFIPQRGFGGGSKDEQQRCRRAVTEVATIGGSKGLGSAYIAQRMAAIDSNVSEQSDVIISHTLSGPNDKRAFSVWAEDTAENPDDVERALARLPRLAVGEAIVLAPDQDVIGAYPIRRRRTFDSSRTPDVGAVLADQPAVRPRLDLQALEERMGDALQEARDNDPAALREQLADARRRLRERDRDPDNGEAVARLAAATADAVEDLAGYVDTIAEATAIRFQQIIAEVERQRDGARADAEAIAVRLHRLAADTRDGQPTLTAPTARAQLPAATAAPAAETTASRAPTRARDAQPEDGPPAGLALEILNAASRGRASGHWLTVSELALLCGKAANGGYFRRQLSALRADGLLDTDNRITADGMEAATTDEGMLPKTGQVVDAWAGRLDGMERDLFTIIASYPGQTVAELAALVDKAPNGGYFRRQLSALRRRGLVVDHNGYRLHPDFDGASR